MISRSVGQPLQKEIINEHFQITCQSELLPTFWGYVSADKSAESALEGLLAAVEELKSNLDRIIADSLPSASQQESECLLRILHINMSISQPTFLFDVIEKILERSLIVWEEMQGRDSEESMDTSTLSESEQMTNKHFWEHFTQVVNHLRALGLLHFFADHASFQIVHKKVKILVQEQCSETFDSAILEDVIASLQETIIGWITQVFGDSLEVRKQWLPQVEYFGQKTFAELRISELFDILVEYPDSEPALCDLRQCLMKVDLRNVLVTSLRETFEKRLLHPGANTCDIITQYISSIKGLRLLDPSGVVLEQVCDPVRSYLRMRDDTVRCIVASLTDYSSNELADELATGEPVLVDLNEESDSEEQDFDSWEPDPIDADPNKTSKSRQTSDIISLLVNIYGSREMFVNEYHSLLADRLLQSLVYDTSREVRNLELLKLRFGEGNLHFCEVMIKDISDSKRINTHLLSQAAKKKKELKEGNEEAPEINAFILSHVFWPAFREEKLKLPDIIQKELDAYCKSYMSLKGLRTLEWKPHLGLVQVDLEFDDREVSLTVSPIRAAIIHYFQQQGTWTVDNLSSILEAQPRIVRRHLGFWVSQGVLKEHPTDTFTVIERQQEGAKTQHGDTEDDEESAMASAEDQKESEFQVFWAYIVGMLTSLGKLKLDRIHSMLRMFAMQGAVGKECSQGELKAFLDRKVREQALAVASGEYHLPK